MTSAVRILCCIVLLLGSLASPLEAFAVQPESVVALYNDEPSEQAPCGGPVTSETSCVLVCVAAHASANARQPLTLSSAYGHPTQHLMRASSNKPDPNPPQLSNPRVAG